MAAEFHTEERIFELIIELSDSVNARKQRLNEYVNKLAENKRKALFITLQYEEIEKQQNTINQLNQLFNARLQKDATQSKQNQFPTKPYQNHPFADRETLRVDNINQARNTWHDHY